MDVRSRRVHTAGRSTRSCAPSRWRPSSRSKSSADPGSVLYGTNAYVGVINVITKVWDSSGVAGVSYGSFDTGTASAAGGKTFGNASDFRRDDALARHRLGLQCNRQCRCRSRQARHHSNGPLVRSKDRGEPQRHIRTRQPGCVLRARRQSPPEQLDRHHQLAEIWPFRSQSSHGRSGLHKCFITEGRLARM